MLGPARLPALLTIALAVCLVAPAAAQPSPGWVKAHQHEANRMFVATKNAPRRPCIATNEIDSEQVYGRVPC